MTQPDPSPIDEYWNIRLDARSASGSSPAPDLAPDHAIDDRQRDRGYRVLDEAFRHWTPPQPSAELSRKILEEARRLDLIAKAQRRRNQVWSASLAAAALVLIALGLGLASRFGVFEPSKVVDRSPILGRSGTAVTLRLDLGDAVDQAQMLGVSMTQRARGTMNQWPARFTPTTWSPWDTPLTPDQSESLPPNDPDLGSSHEEETSAEPPDALPEVRSALGASSWQRVGEPLEPLSGPAREAFGFLTRIVPTNARDDEGIRSSPDA